MLSFWQALVEWQAGGAQKGRNEKYLGKIGLVRTALEEKGYRFPISRERASSTMALCPLPLGTSYAAFFDYFYSQGYVLYQSKKDLAEETFIVSVMGEVSLQQVESWLKLVPAYRG
jgi:aspartate aminotransferase-like enzyme